MQPPSAQSRVLPFAVWNPTRGIWETSQLDLFGLLAPLCRVDGYADRSRSVPGCWAPMSIPVGITVAPSSIGEEGDESV